MTEKYKLTPVAQCHPVHRNENGEQEFVYFRVMTEEEIERANKGSIPIEFDRIEDGKTIFIWNGDPAFGCGEAMEGRSLTKEEKNQRAAQEADQRRADAVRRRMKR